ncbi:hypothetical protein ACQEVF_57640 [Nonomuraea polychroma]|uniref:hypothetical protein n=1 Tax=Nonomuraea polychroma TaxID=46176 RepID=UPI003D92F7AC
MDIVWLATETTYETTQEALRDSGAQVRKRMGFEPLTTLGIIAGVAVLARALRKLFTDSRYRGVLIDTTKSPIEVREMPGWDRNQVLIVTTEGPQFHQFEREPDLQDLLGKLLPGE